MRSAVLNLSHLTAACSPDPSGEEDRFDDIAFEQGPEVLGLSVTR